MPLSIWIIFNLFILFLLVLDLGVFHKKPHAISFKEAILWSIIWILVALAFNGLLYFWKGEVFAMQFLTGYVIERALSIDNIFVFILIFSYFKVPSEYHHRVLFWGIFGALILRALFIVAGITLVKMFGFMMIIFGIFLIYTGVKMMMNQGDKFEPEKSTWFRFIKKVLPLTHNFHGPNFFIKDKSQYNFFGWVATPLFLVLLVVDVVDVVFAVDSIPAILGITQDSFIVYTSNVFAILGLRAMYFALAGIMDKFVYLNQGLSIILIFVGVKMVIEDFIHIPIGLSLGIICGVLLVATLASIWKVKKDQRF